MQIRTLRTKNFLTFLVFFKVALKCLAVILTNLLQKVSEKRQGCNLTLF